MYRKDSTNISISKLFYCKTSIGGCVYLYWHHVWEQEIHRRLFRTNPKVGKICHSTLARLSILWKNRLKGVQDPRATFSDKLDHTSLREPRETSVKCGIKLGWKHGKACGQCLLLRLLTSVVDLLQILSFWCKVVLSYDCLWWSIYTNIMNSWKKVDRFPHSAYLSISYWLRWYWYCMQSHWVCMVCLEHWK